jgi:predicted dehydrogenase
MLDPETYRVGVVGCGLIARAHVRGYQEVGPKLIAGADTSASQRARFRQEYPDVTMYVDYREMLEKEELDLVSVCTWPPFHEEMVVAAAEAGVKGIVCEKPMAVNLGQANHMVQACEQSGTKLVVGHQRRFNRRYVEAKEALQRGEIGELIEVFGNCGGDLLTDGTHNVDLIRFFVDDEPAVWVMGQIDRQPWGRFGYERSRRYGHVIENSAFARIQFRNGVRAILQVGDIAEPEYQYIALQGKEGRIEISGDRHRQPEPSWWRIFRAGEEGWIKHPIEEDVNAFAREIEELIRWIGQDGGHLLSGESAKADMEILMAIFESSYRRARIQLPLDVNEHPLEALVKEPLA